MGRDLALRFRGRVSSAGIDNVRIRTVSPTAPDQVPPAIASMTPQDDSTSVSTVDNLKVIFDENVIISFGFITITDLTSGEKSVINAIDGSQVLIDSTSLEINPTDNLNQDGF